MTSHLPSFGAAGLPGLESQVKVCDLMRVTEATQVLWAPASVLVALGSQNRTALPGEPKHHILISHRFGGPRSGCLLGWVLFCL